ncbi:uncharacterized protein LOC132295865 [Cornus florida]|uniref:uncharacterized protein LOC132295865 n=1 Tax=Cornus florida TaxID=4283 RepID=UPI0028A00E87|nr:uncharacterized protein LOC132295865 [Cornus florida]
MTSHLGLSFIQKITTVIRILAYDCAADHYDKCRGVYTPTHEAEIARLLEEEEHRGFSGMFGSIDCMHWEERIAQWRGTTHIGDALGSHNDINVFNHFPVFNGIVNGQLPPVNYVVNGHHYRMGYYLSDGKMWIVTQGPMRYWEKDDLRLIMKTCIILHNMIIEDERHVNVGRWTPPTEDRFPL